jgi:hypothetical protein
MQHLMGIHPHDITLSLWGCTAIGEMFDLERHW